MSGALDRRNILLGGTSLAAASASAPSTDRRSRRRSSSRAAPAGQRPNILVIWGDDVGLANISAYSFGLMGYKTPNIDRIAREGMMFTDYYAEQSCTAGRCIVHHRPVRPAHRHDQGRPAGRDARPAAAGHHASPKR